MGVLVESSGLVFSDKDERLEAMRGKDDIRDIEVPARMVGLTVAR